MTLKRSISSLKFAKIKIVAPIKPHTNIVKEIEIADAEQYLILNSRMQNVIKNVPVKPEKIHFLFEKKKRQYGKKITNAFKFPTKFTYVNSMPKPDRIYKKLQTKVESYY